MSPLGNVQSPGLGMASLYVFMCRFAAVGTHYRQLCRFCEHHSEKLTSDVGGGLILNSFIGAIKVGELVDFDSQLVLSCPVAEQAGVRECCSYFKGPKCLQNF